MQRPRRVLACIAALLALAGAAAARDPNLPLVHADSPVIGAVAAQPLTADPHPMYVALYKFQLAQDKRSEEAVREYLRRTTLLKIAGLPFQPAGTIGSIMHDASALPPVPDGLHYWAITSAVAVRVADSPDLAGSLRGQNGETFRKVAPGLWLGQTQRGRSHARVLVEFENRTKLPITYVEAELRLAEAGSDRSLNLRCWPIQQLTRLATGEKTVLECELHASAVEERLDALARAMPAWQREPSRIPLSQVRLGFAELGAIVNSNGVIELNKQDAFEEARRQLEQAGCRDRGACFAEGWEFLQKYMLLLLIPAGALLGATAAWMLRSGRGAPVAIPQAERAASAMAAPLPAERIPQATAAPAAKPPRSMFGAALVGAYLVFLGLCAAGVLVDNPFRANRSGMDGVLALLASGLAGFPESFAFLFAMFIGGNGSDTIFVVLCWLAAVFNVWWLGRISGVWGSGR